MRYPIALLLMLLFAPIAGADVTVAADGTGDFKSVQQAVDSTAANSGERVAIHIKPGEYHEKVLIPAGKPPISFIGDDPAKTFLSFDDTANSRDANGDKVGTFLSA